MIEVQRGDVVTVAAGSGFGGKPRPALVIQSDDLSSLSHVIVALFTTVIADNEPIRPLFDPDPINGLLFPSELMADIMVTVPRDKIGQKVGTLSVQDLRRAETALLFVLGFG